MLKEAKGSSDAFFGWSTVTDEAGDPYMFRAWIGRLRLHVFYRGDTDPDCHDHPWDFWTLPLTSYVEEVVDPDLACLAAESTIVAGVEFRMLYRQYRQQSRRLQVVPAFWPSFRPATHCHRVLGRLNKAGMELRRRTSFYAISAAQLAEPMVMGGNIVTIVWRSEKKRSWGFLKNRDGKWCWIAWRDYIFNGGKEGPCQ